MKQTILAVALLSVLLATGGLWLSAQQSKPFPKAVAPQIIPPPYPTPAGETTPTQQFPSMLQQIRPGEDILTASSTTTPVVGTPTTTPSLITVNTPTTVTVTAQITDPSLITGSVNVLRLGATGTQPTILGVMHDDGLHGDAVANDGNYTLQVQLDEATPGQVQMEVSAAFRGRLQRATSPTFLVPVWSIVSQAASGLPFAVIVPPSWTPTPLSNQTSALYLSPSTEEEAGNGISITIVPGSLNSLVADPSFTLISRVSQDVNGRTWTFVVEQEPDSGLQFFNAFLQSPQGTIVVGGGDTPATVVAIKTIVTEINP
jgi:hypothetical protein